MAKTFSVGGSSAQSNKDERKKSLVWLNVGIEMDGVMINVPFGIGLDTMVDLDMPKNVKTEDGMKYAQLVQARNALKAKLLKIADGIEPGEEAVISDLQVTLYKVQEQTEYKPDGNPLLDGINKLFGN